MASTESDQLAALPGQLPVRDSYSHDPAHPTWHFTAPTGWINDPNGLAQWDGTYHLFYQFNPQEPRHRHILWGHATSVDLVHWSDQPIALAPDSAGPDREGCWSGVLVDDDGVPTIVYSAHDGELQLPALATGDATLTTWTKDPTNPVIAAPPEGFSVTAFRDHCVWKEGDTWNQLIGSGIRGVGGTAFLYQSTDLRNWSFSGPILVGDAATREPFWTGTMWECVDLFELDGRHVLIFSAWDEGNTHYSAYYTGSYAAGTFTPDGLHLLDHGLRHFYAPQSFLDEHGRRIIMGWMQEGRPQDAADAAGWSGVLSAPRILSWAPDGRLHMNPVPELAKLRKTHFTVGQRHIEPDQPSLRLGAGRCVDIELTIRCPTDDGLLMLDVLCDRESRERTRVVVDWSRRQLRLDRRASSLDPTDTTDLSAPLTLDSGKVEVRVLLDHSTIEIFANGIALSARTYPASDDAVGVELTAQGGRVEVESGALWQLA